MLPYLFHFILVHFSNCLHNVLYSCAFAHSACIRSAPASVFLYFAKVKIVKIQREDLPIPSIDLLGVISFVRAHVRGRDVCLCARDSIFEKSWIKFKTKTFEFQTSNKEFEIERYGGIFPLQMPDVIKQNKCPKVSNEVFFFIPDSIVRMGFVHCPPSLCFGFRIFISCTY